MMKYLICDIDDTIANLVPELIRICNLMTGKTLTPEDWTSYDIWTIYGINQDDYFKLCESEQILKIVSPIIGTKEAIDFLAENDYYISYLTAREWHNNAYKITLDWLTSHNYELDELHILPLNESKAEYIKMNFDVPISLIIDDNSNHVTEFVNKNIAENIFLIDGVWNRTATHLDSYRVTGFPEIIQKLKL